MISDHMQNHHLQCPKCNEKSGILEEEQKQEHSLEGLSGTTLVSCSECGHDWTAVTHRQIIQSLRQWSASAPSLS